MPYRFFTRAWPWTSVVDIGSGDSPHPRANVLVDAFASNCHRLGDLKTKRPLVVANAERLPFDDSSFDFAISAHCLEHTDDPAKAVREMCRVATCGIIEVPSPYTEQIMSPNDRHKWIFARHDEDLIYSENPYTTFDGAAGFSTTMKMLNESSLFRFYYLNQNQLFRIRVRWRQQVSIVRATPSEVETTFIRSVADSKIENPLFSLLERTFGSLVDRWLFFR